MVSPNPSARLGARSGPFPASPGGACGWVLPLTLDAGGGVPDGRGDALVETARLVVEIVPGERPLLPDFGCRVHWLEHPEHPQERALAAALIEEAIERWAPQLGVDRAEILSLQGTRLAVRLIANGVEYKVGFEHRFAAASGKEVEAW